mgnify:FL=1
MVASKSQNLNPIRKLPVITLLMIGAAIIIALFPGWSPWLIYDRTAILSGQIWRMFTGHWVHFSATHLIYDSLALGVAGWIIETQKLPRFGWLCLLAPWLISAVLLWLEPQMRFFGGLSALATAAIVYLALFGLHDKAPWRWVCAVALLGIVGKIILEASIGQMPFATTGNIPTTVCVTGHVCGAAVALLFYAVVKYGAAKPARVR